MRRLRSTPAVFAVLVALYGGLCLPALAWPGWLDSPVGLWVAIPYVSIYLFDTLGIPGLLRNGGRCDWGWCPPSTFGWAFLAAFWLGVTWLVAAGVARLLRRWARDPGQSAP